MGALDSKYVPGDWNAVCDICGFNFKASELRDNWKGQKVCKDDFETQHPQMFVRPRPEKVSTDWARLPESFSTPILFYTASPQYHKIQFLANPTLGIFSEFYT